MKCSRTIVVLAILTIFVTEKVASQQDAASGNPSDAKGVVANALDTNPPAKSETVATDTSVGSTNTANTTNTDAAVSADIPKTAKSDTTENVVTTTNGAKNGVTNASKNGATNGKGKKKGRPKPRRRMNRRRGRKRNGKKRNGKQKPEANKKENTAVVKPTTTPKLPPEANKKADTQVQAQTQTDAQAKEQSQTDTQAQDQAGTQPKEQTQTDKKAQAQAQPDGQVQAQADAQAQPAKTDVPEQALAPKAQEQPVAQSQTQDKPQDQPQADQPPADQPLADQPQAQTQPGASNTKADSGPPAEALKQKAKTKTEKKPPTKNTPKKKPPQKKPPKKDTFVFDDLFQEYFTTTAASNAAAGPPPEISFDKKSNKVMPNVDVDGALAHDKTPCNKTFKPHETNKHQYQVLFTEGVWGTLDCPPNLGKGLVWRQDLCSCGEELVASDPNDWCGQMGFDPHPTNRHKYNRRHHGAQALMNCASNLVWSQEECLCKYDPLVKDREIEPTKVTFTCKKILHLEFNGNLKNSAEAYHIQPVKLRRRGRLPRIRYVKVPGATEKAAMIVSQPLEFLAYRGNDFQKHVTYSLNFKLSPRHLTRTNFMVLLSDECRENQGGPRNKKPGISLKFQPSTRNFRLLFRTAEAEVDELIKGAEPDRNGWYKTVVYFEDNSINVENNGKKLFSLQDMKGKVPQTKCPLYIAGRGRGFDRSQDFYGYMDNVLLVKDCKFHDANIKML